MEIGTNRWKPGFFSDPLKCQGWKAEILEILERILRNIWPVWHVSANVPKEHSNKATRNNQQTTTQQKNNQKTNKQQTTTHHTTINNTTINNQQHCKSQVLRTNSKQFPYCSVKDTTKKTVKSQSRKHKRLTRRNKNRDENKHIWNHHPVSHFIIKQPRCPGSLGSIISPGLSNRWDFGERGFQGGRMEAPLGWEHLPMVNVGEFQYP